MVELNWLEYFEKVHEYATASSDTHDSVEPVQNQLTQSARLHCDCASSNAVPRALELP